jgi:hypothetical protein
MSLGAKKVATAKWKTDVVPRERGDTSSTLELVCVARKTHVMKIKSGSPM